MDVLLSWCLKAFSTVGILKNHLETCIPNTLDMILDCAMDPYSTRVMLIHFLNQILLKLGWVVTMLVLTNTQQKDTCWTMS